MASRTSRHDRRDGELAELATWRPSRKTLPLGSAPLSWGAAVKSPPEDIAHEIGTRVAALLREGTVNGPTHVDAVMSADLVVVTLADWLTTAAQGVARTEATAIVEELTERPVAAYLTARHHEPDLALLIFYLGRAPLRTA